MSELARYINFELDEAIDFEHNGKTITLISLEDEKITIELDDILVLTIVDDGQSCCEHRYITTDDDIQSLVGSKLLAIVLKNGPEDIVGEYGDTSEAQFLEVSASNGFVTFVTHNDHNGYYGGFDIKMSVKEKSK